MSTTQHPLTDTAAAEMWDASPRPDGCVFRGMLAEEQHATVHAMRAAFDAGREHEITPAEPLARTILAVPEGYGAPHHDAKEIKPDDFVLQVDRDGHIRAGKVHYRDASDDWHTENDDIVTWAECRADRPDAVTVWPALTPPAVEVEMPTEFGVVITDPRWGGWSYARAVHLGEGVWAAEITPGANVHTHLLRDLISATLPDGTRARRDGEHADGTPRFVKTQEEA